MDSHHSKDLYWSIDQLPLSIDNSIDNTFEVIEDMPLVPLKSVIFYLLSALQKIFEPFCANLRQF